MKTILFLLFELVVLSNSAGILNNIVQTVTQPIKSLFPSNNSSDYCFANQNGFNGQINEELVILPISPNQMNVTFLLFTCKNRDEPQNFTYLSEPSEWENSNFDKSVRTRFIVHGYIESYDTRPYMQQLKDLFLNKSCDNVIAVDWSEAAASIIYFPSARNTRVVGQMMGCIINRFKTNFNYNPQNVHLIGHSLGGEAIGFAGKHVQDPKVGQITALDPAGPGFNVLPENNKLAFTDGKCVIAIHTNGDVFGHLNPMANYDFYVNGGVKQPGCYVKDLEPEDLSSIENIEGDIFCSHVRSTKYAIADQNFVNSTCQLIGYTCSSYFDFNLGKCADSTGQGCKPLPLNLDYWDDQNNCDSNTKHVQYFLNTGDVESDKYCLYHYQIIVTVTGTNNICLGEITINLSNGKSIGVTLGPNNSIEPKNGNKRYTKLYTDFQGLGTAEITGVQSPPFSNCVVSNIEINYMSNINQDVRNSMSKSMV